MSSTANTFQGMSWARDNKIRSRIYPNDRASGMVADVKSVVGTNFARNRAPTSQQSAYVYGTLSKEKKKEIF